jgi:hypothetical protein
MVKDTLNKSLKNLKQSKARSMAKTVARELLIFASIAAIVTSSLLIYLPRHAKATGNTRIKTIQYLLDADAIGSSDTAQNSGTVQVNIAESSVTVKSAYLEVLAQFGGASAATYTGGAIKFGSCTTTNCTPTLNTRATLGSQPANSGESQVALFRADVTADFSGYTGGGGLLRVLDSVQLNRGSVTASDLTLNTKLYITYTYDDTSANLSNTVIYPLESTTAGDRGSKAAVQSAGCTFGTNCPTFTYSNYIPEISNASTCNDISNTTSCLENWQEGMGYISAAASTTDYITALKSNGVSSASMHFLEALKGQGGAYNFKDRTINNLGYSSSTTSTSTQNFERNGTTHSLSLMGGEMYTTYKYASTATTRLRTVSFTAGAIKGMNQSTTEFSTAQNVKLPEAGATIQKAWWRVKYSSGDGGGAPLIKLRHYTEGVGTGACADNSQVSYNVTTSVGVTGGGQVSQGQEIIYVIPSSDYATIAAGGLAGKNVGICGQWAVAGGDVSAELMVTYSYTGESSGYLTTATTMGDQQTSAPAQSYTTASNAIHIYAPETVGFNKQMLAGGMDIDYEQNHSAATTGTEDSDITGNGSTGTATEVNVENEWLSFYRNLDDTISTTDGTTYTGKTYATVSTLNSVFSFSVWYTYLYKPQVSVSAVSPAQGSAGDPVTVTASNAGNDMSGNHVVGRTSNTGSDIPNVTGLLIAEKAVLTQGMNLTGADGGKLCIYNKTSSTAVNIAGAVYNDSGGPGSKVAEFSSTAAPTSTQGWLCLTSLATGSSLPAGTYWLAFEGSATAVNWRRDNGIGSNSYCQMTGQTFVTFPSTLTGCSLISGSYSVYAASTDGYRCSTTDKLTFNGLTAPCADGAHNGSNFFNSSNGASAWSNPGNAQFSDNSSADVTIAANNGTSDYLVANTYGFSVPSTATIKGIKLEVSKKSSSALTADNEVRILKNGSIIGNNNAVTSNWNNTSSFAYTTYGSSTDLWGTTWTPADINLAAFGFAFSVVAHTTNVTASVDHIKVTVYTDSGIQTWSDGSITTFVPTGGTSGPLCVTAYNILSSTCQTFTYIPATDQLMRGGNYFDSAGVEQGFWWAR